jgi:hypothetical protein
VLLFQRESDLIGAGKEELPTCAVFPNEINIG